jgi:PAS domain S-box-containing protein
MAFSILLSAGSYKIVLTALTVSIGAVAMAAQAFSALRAFVDRRFVSPAKKHPASDQMCEATAGLQDDERIIVATTDAHFSELLFVGRAYQSIWGRTLESVYADPATALDGIHAEDRARVEERLQRLIGGEPIDGLEFRVVRPGGPTSWVSCQCFPVRDANGEIRRFWASGQDITKRKEVEAELQQNRIRAELVLKSISDMYVVIDRDWRVLYANDSAVRGVGRSREQIVGGILWEIFPHIAGTDLERQYRRAMDGDIPGAVEFHCPIDDSWWETRFYSVAEGLAVFASDITARKRADDQLREYERVVDGLEEMIVVVERRHGEEEYRFVVANRMYLKLRGKDRNQFVGQRVRNMVDAESYDRIFKPKLDECFKGKVVHFEITRSYPEIGERNLSVSYYPVAGPRGVRRAVCVMQDNTERNRADAATRLERDRAQRYLDVADVVLMALDLDGRITLINRKGCAILGWEEDALLGRDCIETCIPERLRDQLRETFRKVLDGDFAYIEAAVVTKSGEERTIAWRNSLLRDSEGRVTGTLSSGEDITERKKSEEALTLFRNLIDQSNDSFEVVDPETLRILDVNQKACIEHGYTREELLSRTVFDIDPTVSRGRDTRVSKQLRESGTAMWEGIHLRKDGSTFPVEVNLKLIQLEKKKYIVAVARDVTERKRAEDERRRLSGELLRLQDEERRRIARGLHDSTGQNLVALATDLAQARSLIPSANRRPRKLLHECQALAHRCVREVRTLSYLLHPPMLDEAGLEDAIRHYANGLAERVGIRVALEISPRFERLTPDIEVALFRVVQESLTNIQRHSGSAEAKIRIARHPGKITMEVSDTGKGMRGIKRGQNGELPFGIGVGISSMSERVRLIGGQLEIESSKSGTTVRVTIPIDG